MSANSSRSIELRNETAPIDSTLNRYTTLFANLQGNILKSHGRDFALHIFIEFTGAQDKVKIWIANFTNRYVTSALRQMDETKEYKLNGISGRAFGSFMLSAAGYEALGFGDHLAQFLEDTPVSPTTDARFVDGMEKAQSILNDPDPTTWDEAYQGQKIHALIILADEDPNRLNDVRQRVEATMPGIARVLVCEEGFALRDTFNKPIEHFGYRDGISQPVFFQDDVRDVVKKAKVASHDKLEYDPSAGLDLVLVKDPFTPRDKHGRELPDCFGSYFVFRKLEENVRGFKQAEEELANTLGLTDEEERERAGALVVGRFEDGVPVELSARQAKIVEQNGQPKFDQEDEKRLVDANNFNYHNDLEGRKCPIHAHIRKTNPRGDTARVLLKALGIPNDQAETDRQERARRIARRGITYGHRALGANGMPTLEDLPRGGVGLLFQCYQALIRNQFAFMQQGWVNNSEFAKPGLGIDPVIGQFVKEHTGLLKWPPTWQDGDPANDKAFDFGDFVTMKGGEFFFAPSIPFLRKLDGVNPSVARDQKEFKDKAVEPAKNGASQQPKLETV